MEKIYIYPSFDSRHDKTGNTYIKEFHSAFSRSGRYRVINRFPSLQVFSMPFNLDAAVFVIHWVDLIPRKPLGCLQSLLFMLVISLADLLGKRIVWVLHNKRAHAGESQMSARLMRFMAGRSDLVITHSKEGVGFFRSSYPDADPSLCVYIPHPVYDSVIRQSSEIRWDYIIWGGIDRRKNVAGFLKFAASAPGMSGKKILICGRCADEEYDRLIRDTLTPDMTYENRFLTDEELASRISASGAVLFTYSPESVLSSGALIYSLNFLKPVIGPRVGSFADLEGIVACYDVFEDIPSLVLARDVSEKALEYIAENSWDDFVRKFDMAQKK